MAKSNAFDLCGNGIIWASVTSPQTMARLSSLRKPLARPKRPSCLTHASHVCHWHDRGRCECLYLGSSWNLRKPPKRLTSNFVFFFKEHFESIKHDPGTNKYIINSHKLSNKCLTKYNNILPTTIATVRLRKAGVSLWKKTGPLAELRNPKPATVGNFYGQNSNKTQPVLNPWIVEHPRNLT